MRGFEGLLLLQRERNFVLVRLGTVPFNHCHFQTLSNHLLTSLVIEKDRYFEFFAS